MSTATPSLDDTRLARRAVRGSSRAFEAIFRRYHQDLYRYCAAIVGNSADAQDAVQNTMVKVLQALPGEERRIELKPWLYRIAHNEAIEIVRRRPPAEAVDADSLLGPANAAEQVETRDRLRRLVADVGQLPERQRGALVMRELGGLGFEEIGAALGTSAATARQTVYEARLGLRAMSEGREMDCAEAMRAISDGDRRLFRGRRLRAHLRSCEGCRSFRAGIDVRRADLALLAPLPAVASTGILHGVLGGAAAGKSLLGATAIKTAAAVGVVAAVGVTAADRGGLIDLGAGHSLAPPAAKSSPPAAGAGAESARGDLDAGRGGAPALAVPASARHAAGRSARTGPALSGRRPVNPAAAAAPQPGHPQSAPHPGHPSGAPPPGHQGPRQPGLPPAAKAGSPAAGAPSAAAGAPAAGTPPARADHGRHLGQLHHPAGGQAPVGAGSNGRSDSAPGHRTDGQTAAGAGSNGRSDSAPGQTKAAQAPAEPSHAPAESPGSAGKSSPPEASSEQAQSPSAGPLATPANQDAAEAPVDTPGSSRTEASSAAEPAAAGKDKSGASPSTP